MLITQCTGRQRKRASSYSLWKNLYTQLLLYIVKYCHSSHINYSIHTSSKLLIQGILASFCINHYFNTLVNFISCCTTFRILSTNIGAILNDIWYWGNDISFPIESTMEKENYLCPKSLTFFIPDTYYEKKLYRTSDWE